MPSKFRLIYFSGTGNTEWVADKLAEALAAAKTDCRKLAADRLLAECGLACGRAADAAELASRLDDFLDGDSGTLLALFAVYGSDLPRPMKMVMECLPRRPGWKTAAIGTVAEAGGDAAVQAFKYTSPKGFDPVLARLLKMPNNLRLAIPVIGRLFKIENGPALERFRQPANQAVGELAADLLAGNKRIGDGGCLGKLFGMAQRGGEALLKFDRYIGRNLLADDQCRHCGLCAAICPMGNIEAPSGERPRFANRCCMCMRCYHFCPYGAIQITAATADAARYPRYQGFDGWHPRKLR